MNKYILAFVVLFIITSLLIGFFSGAILLAPMYVRLPLMLNLFGGMFASIILYKTRK